MPDVAEDASVWLAIIAAVSILYGAVMTLIQTDLKRLIAYSSVSHMGYVLLGASALGTVGLTGASMQMFTHGLITGMLFVLVGMVYDRAHTRNIGELSGLAHRMPFITVMMLVAGLASLGLPALAGFVSEVTVFLGTFEKHEALTIAGVIGDRLRGGVHPLDDPAGVLGRAEPALGRPPGCDSLVGARAAAGDDRGRSWRSASIRPG